MNFHEYDPHQYSITFNGIPIDGFAEDDFVNIEMATDGFSDEVDADGHVTRKASLCSWVLKRGLLGCPPP
jgi:hypothetical protein